MTLGNSKPAHPEKVTVATTILKDAMTIFFPMRRMPVVNLILVDIKYWINRHHEVLSNATFNDMGVITSYSTWMSHTRW